MGDCVDNCCSPPHQLPLSQVAYYKGTGGLEIHAVDLPAGRTAINFDVAFRDRVDPSTYVLRIGCANGCLSKDGPVTAPRFLVNDYQKGINEPFTQARLLKGGLARVLALRLGSCRCQRRIGSGGRL